MHFYVFCIVLNVFNLYETACCLSGNIKKEEEKLRNGSFRILFANICFITHLYNVIIDIDVLFLHEYIKRHIYKYVDIWIQLKLKQKVDLFLTSSKK